MARTHMAVIFCWKEIVFKLRRINPECMGDMGRR